MIENKKNLFYKLTIFALLILFSTHTANTAEISRPQNHNESIYGVQAPSSAHVVNIPGIGELRLKAGASGEFELTGKRMPVKFTGHITSPTEFSLKAEISISELEIFSSVLSKIAFFPKAVIELTPKGLKLNGNITFSEILSGVSQLLKNHFSLKAFNIPSNIQITDKITIKSSFPEKHVILSEHTFGSELSAENIHLDIVIDLKNMRIISSDIHAELKLKPSSHDQTVISLKSRIFLDLAKKNVTINAANSGEIKSLFGIKSSNIQKFAFKYEGSKKIFEIEADVQNFNFSELPFSTNTLKNLFKKISVTRAAFRYANKAGVIFDENIKSGLNIQAAIQFDDVSASLLLNYEPSTKSVYLETGLKNFALNKLGIVPVSMQNYLPEITFESLLLKYSNTEQTVNTVKLKAGYLLTGSVKIGDSTSKVTVTHETAGDFLLIDYKVDAVNFAKIMPQSIIPSSLKQLLEKIIISQGNLRFSNKTAIHKGEKIYHGIHINGKMQFGNSTGDFTFIYDKGSEIVSLNTSMSRITLAGFPLLPHSINEVLKDFEMENARLEYINKSGLLEGKAVKQGLTISGNVRIGAFTGKFDVYYHSEKQFFAMKSKIDRASLSNIFLPGLKLTIPDEVKTFLDKFQVNNVDFIYANNKGKFLNVDVKKGLTLSGNFGIPGSTGKFKIVNQPEEKLFYLFTSIDKISPVTLGIIPAELKETASRYNLTNASIVYASKKVTIDGAEVDAGLRLSGSAQLNRITCKFLFFYNKKDNLYYLKTHFPNATLYDINQSVIPLPLPEVISNFARNTGVNDVSVVYANKNGNVGGVKITAGTQANGKMHIYSVFGDFKFIYNKNNQFYGLKINLKNVNLGSLPLLPNEVKNIASKMQFSHLSFVYANKNGKMDGDTVYIGFDFSGNAQLGNVDSSYRVQYDTENKAVVLSTHIVRATLKDINVFSDSAWMPAEMNHLSEQCSVENADVIYSNFTGSFRGKKIQKGLKVTGTLEIFSKKATFELDYLTEEKLYYFNTTVDGVSLYDVNVFRAVSGLPSQMRNFGKNIIMSHAVFTYANKAGLIGTKKISEGLSINGKFQLGNKTGTIDFRYSSQKQLYGLELTLDKITLSDIDIISWFVTTPSNIKKFTDKISLENIQLKYANKNGEISGKKYEQGMSLEAAATFANKKGNLLFLSNAKLHYFELKLDKANADDFNIFKDFISLPTLDNSISSIVSKFKMVSASFVYASNTGTIFKKEVKSGLTIRAAVKYENADTDLLIKYEPQKKLFYLETSLKNFSLNKLGVIPANMQKYLPEFTVETLTIKYANKEQTIENVLIKHGFTINGKVNIGGSTTDIKITQETDTQFTLVELDVNSVNFEQFVPQQLIPSHMKDLFSKISIRHASLKYANKSGVHDGKKVYQGIHLEGNIRYAENTGSVVFIYSDENKILSLNAKLSKIALSKISAFPSSVNNIITGIQIQNASLDYVNKTGTLEGNPVKAGLNITGDLVLGGVTTKFDVVYDKDKNFFAIKSTINRIGLSDVSFPGVKLAIPENIKDYLKKFQASSVTITYANNKGVFHDVELKKGFTASGNITIPGSEGKFKLINLPEEKLFYVYTFINKINPVSLGIIPNELSATASKYSLTNAQIVYSSIKTTIDGTDVDKGLRLSADAQMNRIQTKFLFFYNKEDSFYYLKTIFPSTTLYDINKSVLPIELPEIINNFAKNVGTNDVVFEYANKNGKVDGKVVEAGIRTSGKMHIYSAQGGFKFIYDKKEKFYYLNINMNRINLGSLPLLPVEIKNIASKITFSQLSLVYANKNGKVDGNTVYTGFDFSGNAQMGNVNSSYRVQYDTESKAVVLSTHIVRATLKDINVFSDSAWMPAEINRLSQQCAVENADVVYSTFTGTFRGKKIQKGLKVTGTLEIFSKKATFELDYLTEEKLYYLNTTVQSVSLYDVNIFKSIQGIPSEIRNFGKDIILKSSSFTYANKTGQVGNKKVSEGLAIHGEYSFKNKNGHIDFRYSSQNHVYGLELTLNKVTLSDVNILSWFITVPSEVKKITDKISLENIKLNYANKTGQAAGKEFNQGFTLAAEAHISNKKANLRFLNNSASSTYYLELKVGRISLDDLNIFKEFIHLPDAVRKLGRAIAVKDFTFGYANKDGKIDSSVFKRGYNVGGTPDLSGIPGVGTLLKSLHLNNLKMQFQDGAGIYFDAKIKFHGKLNNFMEKFLKLRLQELDVKIGFNDSQLYFSVALVKLSNLIATINPLLGTQLKLNNLLLKISVPISGGLPIFEFDAVMQVKPSKRDKWLNFTPSIKFNPVTQSVGFAATMKDKWEHPFGIQAGNILIENVAFEIMINMMTGIPTKIGFIGEHLRFFGKNFGFMFLVSADKDAVSLGFKVDKLTFNDIPGLNFLPLAFLKNSAYLRNVDVNISPTGGSIGEIQIKPGITIKGEAKLGPMNGYIDLSTGSLTSFKGYFKGQVNTGLNEIKHAVLEKVKKIPFLKPMLSKILNSFGVNSIKFDFNASTTKVKAMMEVSILLIGKTHNLSLNVEFNPLKLAADIAKKIEHFLADELKKIWNALKKEATIIAQAVKKEAVKLYSNVKNWMKNNIAPYISAVSDYVKKIAYTAYQTVKEFFQVKQKDWWKPWKWHWKTITKFVKKAYTAFRYEVHSFSYDQRLTKLKEYAAQLIKHSTDSSMSSVNNYLKQILQKITDFDGDMLKNIVDENIQTLLDNTSSHWLSVYNDSEAQHFFNNSADNAKGLKEYRALITGAFQALKTKIIEAFKKSFTEKPAVLKLISEKAGNVWFKKFAVSQ